MISQQGCWCAVPVVHAGPFSELCGALGSGAVGYGIGLIGDNGFEEAFSLAFGPVSA